MAEKPAYDESVEEAQFDFLRNHLMAWTVEFSAVMTSAATTSFYQGLAELTMSFLFNERMFSFSILSEQAANEGYALTLEKMAAAIDALDLSDDYVTITEGAEAPDKMRTVKSHCFICLGLCGQEIKVKDNIITSIPGSGTETTQGAIL